MFSRKEYRKRQNQKEIAGELTRVLCLYGTQAMADEAGMSLEDYWQEIIKACYLDLDDPIAEWRKTFTEIETIKNRLTALSIEYVHVT